MKNQPPKPTARSRQFLYGRAYRRPDFERGNDLSILYAPRSLNFEEVAYRELMGNHKEEEE